ncbi:MAG: dual specificity protein phosphatase family protein [Candidatus Methylacidiphilales bacterium]|nr:dual specificity protein phosphatase family protein [Candidatus Methylacidiphilales bacterium]
MSAPSDLLWWVLPGKLAGMHVPFLDRTRYTTHIHAGAESLPDDLAHLWQSGVRCVVSLLNNAADGPVYNRAGLEYLSLPVRDGGIPTTHQALRFLHFTDEALKASKPVAVHCAAGRGRTGTMLALYLIHCFQLDHSETAIEAVRKVRPGAIETYAQEAFLQDFATNYAHFMASYPGKMPR